MNLYEARETLRDSVLHVGDDSNLYTIPRLDRAIRAATSEFVNVTNCTRSTLTVPTVANQRTVDPTSVSGGEDFLPGRIQFSPYISATDDFRRLRSRSFNNIRSLYEYAPSEREPEMYAFTSRDQMYLYPVPDAVYNLAIVWVPAATSWTIGTDDPDSITLNVPDVYMDELLWSGARAKMLRGLPGHPEAEAAAVDFERLKLRVKGEVFGTAVWDVQDEPEDGPYYRGLGV